MASGFTLSADSFKNQSFQTIHPYILSECQTVLDPDQARHFVGPDLGSNCLQILSADDTGRKRFKHYSILEPIIIIFSQISYLL